MFKLIQPLSGCLLEMSWCSILCIASNFLHLLLEELGEIESSALRLYWTLSSAKNGVDGTPHSLWVERSGSHLILPENTAFRGTQLMIITKLLDPLFLVRWKFRL